MGVKGKGIATIMEMAASTRIDCVLGTAGMQRRALMIAIDHARHRRTFGKELIAQPLMQNVLVLLSH
jgi:putative acyl-CoA dehydrogenase